MDFSSVDRDTLCFFKLLVDKTIPPSEGNSFLLTILKYIDAIARIAFPSAFFYRQCSFFSPPEFPSRRAKFRRDCENASGIPSAFLFVSPFLPSALSSFFFYAVHDSPFRDSRGVASAKTKRIPSRNKETSPGVKRLDRSLFFARHLLCDSVSLCSFPFLLMERKPIRIGESFDGFIVQDIYL